jgi:MFS family permease
MKREDNAPKETLYTRGFFCMSGANLFFVASLASFFIFPILITEYGGDKVQIGVLMGVMAMSSVLARPWISGLVDRIGRKRSYTLGLCFMLITPLGYLLFQGPLTWTFWPLFFLRMLHGLGAAFCFTAGFTFIADIVPIGRLNEGIGMFGTTGLMGMALGPVVGEAVIRTLGANAYFVTGTLLAALSFVLHLSLVETYVHDTKQPQSTFFQVLGRKKISGIGVVALLFGTGLAAYGSFVSPYGEELGLRFVSGYFLAYSGAAVMTRLWGGRLADRVGEARVVPWALVVTGGGFFLLMPVQGMPLLVLAGLVTGCGHGLLYPCLNALALRDEPAWSRGKINGIYTGGIDSGVFLGAVVLGWIGQQFGFPALFGAAGASLLTGLVVYRLWVVRAMGGRGASIRRPDGAGP